MSAASGEPARTPAHVAIIMDGNGRWAASRGLPRALGHRQGVEAVRALIKGAGGLGLTHLTLFGFSTENWQRPQDEVNALFDLLRQFVGADLAGLAREGVRVRIIGSRDGLSDDLLEIVERAERDTRHNTRFHLTVAFNYGARDEIVRAVNALTARAAETGKAQPLDEAEFAAVLDTQGLPDPDLIIRTSGEMRLSNFLLWQGAYSELVFIDVLWPDFTLEHLREAIAVFQSRERRFGGR
ncbi:MAG: di-trans,poly-cis-decaprenylcistransferase [Oceanicaulis sp.]|uniref:polyprenyl diphosphate synthase n=1 Tax=Glycocaulis sp. TaxID=1969725 RepID=UPI0025BEE8FC|nr:polyprenyl diphosphate synthase [Glycocaulis sp.]MCC5980442.1 di-trans,poly-cis-decaprenylcistransferase [Oceanicaulis sp.]MCH8521371.1 di-trans,poly-cis-decaprenylcistransferase [Glycocaulis sp.]